LEHVQCARERLEMVHSACRLIAQGVYQIASVYH
jgi:hypothetical protein